MGSESRFASSIRSGIQPKDVVMLFHTYCNCDRPDVKCYPRSVEISGPGIDGVDMDGHHFEYQNSCWTVELCELPHFDL